MLFISSNLSPPYRLSYLLPSFILFLLCLLHFSLQFSSLPFISSFHLSFHASLHHLYFPSCHHFFFPFSFISFSLFSSLSTPLLPCSHSSHSFVLPCNIQMLRRCKNFALIKSFPPAWPPPSAPSTPWHIYMIMTGMHHGISGHCWRFLRLTVTFHCCYHWPITYAAVRSQCHLNILMSTSVFVVESF